MKLFKNRTIVGLLCIILSLVICFGLTPLFNSAKKSQMEIVRITNDISKGTEITAKMITVVTVGSYNLPTGVLTRKEAVVGTYAKVDMKAGDMVFASKLSSTPLEEFSYLSELDGTKEAISVTITSFAAGLSAKLESGDIVSLISVDYNNMGITEIPEELKYVKVLAVTLGNGSDKKENGIESTVENTSQSNAEDELPATITLLVNSEQAVKLADIEKKGKIHVVMVYRGSNENAEKFLAEQEKVFSEEIEALDDESQVDNGDETSSKGAATISKGADVEIDTNTAVENGNMGQETIVTIEEGEQNGN